jgi:hypothetical protein
MTTAEPLWRCSNSQVALLSVTLMGYLELEARSEILVADLRDQTWTH